MIKMNEECKYCSYLKQCQDVVEHNSIYCKCHKRTPKDRNMSYEQLQNNWNELKKIIEQDIRQCEELIEECPKGLRNTIVGTGSYEGIIGYNKYILSKMQELEQGKDE